ncbi:MAG: class I SAM-dependent methyltransferase [Rhodocyclaceae bacterium]|nr:class I SAM-dependent methyltransferase [Rhodocyclaceae bacterium]
MTRKRKRTADFELNLEIRRDGFVRPPRDSQRNWLLNGLMAEVVDQLRALDRIAARLVPGSESLPLADRSQVALADDEIMEDWQIPLMKALAEIACEHHGDVLEIGFGRGISAGFIQQLGARSHTIIECNASICERFERWRATHAERTIRLVPGLWQDALPELGRFDGVLFHTYPLDEEEFIDHIAGSTTFAEHFFEHAAAHLVDGGIFTYLSNEIDSLSRGHQRALLNHFRSIELRRFDGLDLPPDVRDAWWADSMMLVRAVK